MFYHRKRKVTKTRCTRQEVQGKPSSQLHHKRAGDVQYKEANKLLPQTPYLWKKEWRLEGAIRSPLKKGVLSLGPLGGLHFSWVLIE